MVESQRRFHTFVVLLLASLSVALAHGHDEGSSAMDMGGGPSHPDQEATSTMAAAVSSATAPALDSYFAYPTSSGLMVAHVAFMTVAWAFVLPAVVMLSIARSNLALPAQLNFLSINALGLLMGLVYNRKTPDLYENNAHHIFGWIVTWIVAAQALLGLVRRYAIAEHQEDDDGSGERTAFLPMSVEALEQHQRLHDLPDDDHYRYSHDSGQGTEPASSRSHSLSSLKEEKPYEPRNDDNDRAHRENSNHLPHGAIDRFLSRKISSIVSARASNIVGMLYGFVDRTILILGFVALTTGVATYGGIFRGNHIFNGLAHFIKGGVFFWYGLLTLGRCMGCFADLGWAWNVKPSANMVGSKKAAVPSAEFVESFLIFFYGSTNVFLEHLSSWGKAWSAQDLEHVSISIMFFGGGLCGMLIESRKIRDLLNTLVTSLSNHPGIDSSPESWLPPRPYAFSMNPIPGLIILLLGLMMSSHHQESMVSTMVHKQWGTLFVGAAFARGVTYILVYLSPPSSFLPSRPPSELIVSFCLISGGLIFMASNKDTVAAMEAHNLNAMFVFTVMMGVTAFLMAWTILVLAVKGWALRREQRRLFLSRNMA